MIKDLASSETSAKTSNVEDVIARADKLLEKVELEDGEGACVHATLHNATTQLCGMLFYSFTFFISSFPFSSLFPFRFVSFRFVSFLFSPLLF